MAIITTAPKIDQLRYYGVNNARNYPNDNPEQGKNVWIKESENHLLSNYGNVIKLGIQGLPGTKFFLNNLSNGIVIDHTGVYELDLTNTTAVISSLYFDPVSLTRISEIDNAVLIVDILYYEAVKSE